MVLIGANIIDTATGVALILIGIFLSLLVFVVASSEVSKLGSNIEDSFETEVEDVLDNISCALLSGTCCYAGIPCCCPNGTGNKCEISPNPPQ
jgi:uncharacterized membrane protein